MRTSETKKIQGQVTVPVFSMKTKVMILIVCATIVSCFVVSRNHPVAQNKVTVIKGRLFVEEGIQIGHTEGLHMVLGIQGDSATISIYSGDAEGSNIMLMVQENNTSIMLTEKIEDSEGSSILLNVKSSERPVSTIFIKDGAEFLRPFTDAFGVES